MFEFSVSSESLWLRKRDIRMEDELTRKIIGAAIEVHRVLGPGLLESIYEDCLCHELTLQGISFERQKPVDVNYKGMEIESGYKMDLIVDGKVVVELKAVQEIHPLFEAQLLTYMKLTGCKVGLLINFNVPVLKDGVKRMVL